MKGRRRGTPPAPGRSTEDTTARRRQPRRVAAALAIAATTGRWLRATLRTPLVDSPRRAAPGSSIQPRDTRVPATNARATERPEQPPEWRPPRQRTTRPLATS